MKKVNKMEKESKFGDNHSMLEEKIAIRLANGRGIQFTQKEPEFLMPDVTDKVIMGTHWFSPVTETCLNAVEYAKKNGYSLAVVKDVSTHCYDAKLVCNFYNIGSQN